MNSIIKIFCATITTALCWAPMTSDWSQSIAQTLHTVGQKGFYQTPMDDAIVQALNTFVHAQDTHSRFLGPKEFGELRKNTSGTFYGIGVSLAPKKTDDDFLVILDVVPEGPAQKAGLKRYDKIIAVDSSPVKDLTFEQTVDKIKGEKRFSKVSFDILRNSKELMHVDLERDEVKDEQLICYYEPTQKIVYCRIGMFTKNIASQLREKLTLALEKHPIGIILDLRDNLGGVYESSAECGECFLPKNSLVVYTKDRKKNIKDRLHTKTEPIVGQIPIIMLVNELSASCSEIFVGSLEIHSRQGTANPHMFTLGTITNGKGSVQEVLPIGNCALKLTTGLYYLADNRTIHQKGITPTFCMEPKYPASDEIKALTKLFMHDDKKEKEEKPAEPTEKDPYARRKQALQSDHYIQQAMHIIRLIRFGQSVCPEQLKTHRSSLEFLRKMFVSEQTIQFTPL